jgi:hypothetical protein
MSDYSIYEMDLELEDVIEQPDEYFPYTVASVSVSWATEREMGGGRYDVVVHSAFVDVDLVDDVVVGTAIAEGTHQVETVVVNRRTPDFNLRTDEKREPVKADARMTEHQWAKVRKSAALFTPRALDEYFGRLEGAYEETYAYPNPGLKTKLLRR